MPEPLIRSYQEGDEDAIVGLFHRRFHPHRSLAHWRWKFRHHPWGAGIVSLAFDEHDELIAHCAGYPVRLLVFAPSGSAEAVPCLHVGDVMATRQALRGGLGGGVFAATLHHLHERVRECGLGFTYGVAAPAMERFYLRVLGRRRVENVAYRRLRPPGLLAGARGGLAPSGPFRVERVERTGPEFDALLAAAGPGYGVLAQRDAAYVGWRYCDCPDRSHRLYGAWRAGRLVGWAAFRSLEASLVWGDALIDPEHPGAGEALLRGALQDHGGESVDAVEAWFPARPAWWQRVLEDIGFELRAEPRELRLIYRCVGAARCDEQQVVDRSYYTMGDTDLF